MKKFRVTLDTCVSFFYLHKRFLKYFWVKYSLEKSNCHMKHENVYEAMTQGSYNFASGEYGTYYICVDNKSHHTIEYYDSAEDYLNKNSEYML